MTAEQNATKATIAALYGRMHKALQLEQQGLLSHAKTQSVVSGLMFQVERLMMLSKHVNDNSNKMIARQQRTNQNNGGNP